MASVLFKTTTNDPGRKGSVDINNLCNGQLAFDIKDFGNDSAFYVNLDRDDLIKVINEALGSLGIDERIETETITRLVLR